MLIEDPIVDKVANTETGASQQTFRGPPEADRGRTTPSSGNLEMTEDDVAHYHQLMKDHKELST